jgi:surface carbohydrate biosynthesis protein
MKNILFLFAYKRRDLMGNCLIAHAVKKEGYNFIHANSYDVQRKIYKYKPIAVIFDHLAWNHKIEQAKLCKKLGIKVVVYNTEGFLYKPTDASNLLGSKFGKKPLFDHVMTWGIFQKNGALEFFENCDQNIAVTGCARFDFYHSKFKTDLFLKSEFLTNHKINNSNPIILWATNTPYANYSYNKIVSRYVKKANWNKEAIIEYWEVCKSQQHNHAKIIMKLAEKHPNWNFIIKVHPAEQLNFYLDIENKYNNVVLGYEEGIQSYILNCDLVIQRNSTVYTEAWISNTPVIHIEDDKSYADYTSRLLKGNIVTRNFEETENKIKDILSNSYVLSNDDKVYREKTLEKYYYKVDGNSYLRIADSMLNFLKKSVSDKSVIEIITNISRDHEIYVKNENSRLINKFKDFLSIPRSFSLNIKVYYNKVIQYINGETEKIIVSEAEASKQEIDFYYKKFTNLNIK